MKITKNIIYLFDLFFKYSFYLILFLLFYNVVNFSLQGLGFSENRHTPVLSINIHNSQDSSSFDKGYNKTFNKYKCSYDIEDKLEHDTVIKNDKVSIKALSAYELSYDIDGESYFSHKESDSISIVQIDKFPMKTDLIYKLTKLLLYFILLLCFYELKAIFRILRLAKNTNDWFSERIYKALNRITRYSILFIIVEFISINTCLLMMDNICINGIEQYTSIEYPEPRSLVICVFLFITSQVYKAGVVMREEQDLTI